METDWDTPASTQSRSVKGKKTRKFGTIYNRLETWAGCMEEPMQNLPPDIDGLKKYVVKSTRGDKERYERSFSCVL